MTSISLSVGILQILSGIYNHDAILNLTEYACICLVNDCSERHFWKRDPIMMDLYTPNVRTDSSDYAHSLAWQAWSDPIPTPATYVLG
ncbi:hypothetical protein K474DRAFT_985925 [Panus rudis PR-1116 ss-1]|nr:hypothetical protein K474DRAFT_985925 [Panus rudis PR-1116 ss-1]